MQIVSELVDFILHLDVHLNTIIQNFGVWTYLILFLIIFMETGFVITPFLPGDLLLFAAGSFAALGSLNVWALFITLTLAAILGDTINYWIGHYIGPRAFSGNVRFLKKSTSIAPMIFMKSMVARRSSWPASSPSSAPLLPS